MLAADVIHKLNIEGSCIDIILADANILVANGADILKYIMRNIELKRIPLISKLILTVHFYFLPSRKKPSENSHL